MAENYIDHWNANGQMYDIQDAGRGLPNGVATLDLTGRVPYSQLPESAVEFKGYWNATTNTPTLADGTGTKGDMYYVDVAGTQDLGSGTQRFYVGDRVLYDGSVWKNMNPDLIDLFLPVGHLIWTGNSNFNPNTQYPGTTWTQIKDKFVLAAGDTYTNGATGGSATVTLTVDQIPSHDHSFTPSGSVSVTTNPTFSGSAHSHSYTPAGSVSVTTNPSFTGTASDTGGMSANSSGYAGIGDRSGRGSALVSGPFSYQSRSVGGQRPYAPSDSNDNTSLYINVAHTHSFTPSGSISGGAYKFTGTSATLTATQGGTISGGAYKFTGTAGTTGAKGSGQAHDNMPPYIVKYCWERTA